MIDAPVADVRRADLAAFLRSRRSALRPGDVGIAPGSRRHVPGLRREEIASIAGISTTWYTWIEQGRPINISLDVLEKIGNALRFEDYEIEFMRALLRDDPQTCPREPQVPEALCRLVESHEAAPAYIATPRFDLLVWNAFVGEIFGYQQSDDVLQRNVLWRMFFDPSRRSLYVDWDGAAAMAVGNFRNIYTKYRGDDYFEELREAMSACAEFRRYWDAWQLLTPGRTPPFRIRHQKIGLCEVTPIQATLDIAPDCYLALYSCVRTSA